MFHFCSYMWLKWFECIYDYLLFIDVFNTSSYDKHLGASFCISQVLSTYFSFCFNSCIVKHNLKMISYSLCRILSFQNHIFKFPVFKGYIWRCLCWSMKIKNPENFNENWWTKHKTSNKLHFFYKQLRSLKVAYIFNFFPGSNLVNGCFVVWK